VPPHFLQVAAQKGASQRLSRMDPWPHYAAAALPDTKLEIDELLRRNSLRIEQHRIHV
jgi:hypothetical protein